MHDGFMGTVAMTGDMHVWGGAVQCMAWSVSRSPRTAVMVPAAAERSLVAASPRPRRTEAECGVSVTPRPGSSAGTRAAAAALFKLKQSCNNKHDSHRDIPTARQSPSHHSWIWIGLILPRVHSIRMLFIQKVSDPKWLKVLSSSWVKILLKMESIKSFLWSSAAPIPSCQ